MNGRERDILCVTKHTTRNLNSDYHSLTAWFESILKTCQSLLNASSNNKDCLHLAQSKAWLDEWNTAHHELLNWAAFNKTIRFKKKSVENHTTNIRMKDTNLKQKQTNKKNK